MIAQSISQFSGSKLLRLIIFSFAFGTATNSFAQSGTLAQVIPPSPSSREYDKYINYQVSLYNGVPQISIPLYEIKTGSISIPISLNYHASGIKYGQADGEVGVGWVLEPGYRISRTICGRPDELYPKPTVGGLDVPWNFSTKKLRDTYLSQFIWLGQQDIPQPTQLSDGEYDLFTYSLPSESGTFVIEDRQTKKVCQISRTNLSIDYNKRADQSIEYFELKDGKGVKYTTGPIENNANLAGSQPIPASAWVMSDIEDLFGNYVKFSYTPYRETSIEYNASFIVHSASDPNTEPFGPCTQYGSADLTLHEPTPYDIQRISAITSNELTVTFNRSGPSGVLNAIVIKNKRNETLRRIEFTYSTSLHSFLDTIKISGSEINDRQIYAFSYYGRGYEAYNLYQFTPDYWGYYKRQTSIGNNFPAFGPYTYCSGPNQVQNLQSLGLSQNNRDVGFNNDAVHFTLHKITYPTGGTTTYEYEPNAYSGFSNGQPATKYAGIRVKKISSNDLINSETLTKQYVYGANGNGIGQVSVDLATKEYFMTERPGYICTDATNSNAPVYLAKEILFSTKPHEELASRAFIGAPVQYNKVVEYENTGKTEYIYDVPWNPNWMPYTVNDIYTGFLYIFPYDLAASCATIGGQQTTGVGFPNYYVSNYRSWDIPVLKTRTVYKNNGGGSYQLLVKDSCVYNVIGENNFNLEGLKVRRFLAPSNANYSSGDFYSNDINSVFDYATYYISTANKVLSEKMTDTYAGGEVLRERTRYQYNSDFQISTEESWNSDNSVTTTITKYPVDYDLITAADNISVGVKKMQSAHLLNTWVEKVKMRVASTDKLVSAFFQVYKPDRPLADKLMTIESASPITDFSHSSNAGGAINLDTRYQPKLMFNTYDSRGNIQEQQKVDDVKEAYFWGYDSRYPVAKVIGSDYNTAKVYIDQDLLNNIGGIYTDEQIRTELNKLRINLPNARVTTYTYAPLVGMTSETNPAGRTTFYEYDSLGRLKLIKDHNGNILKQFDYQHKTSVVP